MHLKCKFCMVSDIWLYVMYIQIPDSIEFHATNVNFTGEILSGFDFGKLFTMPHVI